jgi:tRNA pseudouridine55 synthase
MQGALIIDKPEHLTSHDVVDSVRRAILLRRVGHAGTLDPFATGVLVVCAGQATRLIQFLVGLDKKYTATVRLGFATDTQDYTGIRISPAASSKGLSLEDIKGVVKEFIGPQWQMPPMFSAKKVGGERLYKAAREGREVERQPVMIDVYGIELSSTLKDNRDETREFSIDVHCSSGTYIRTLAHDLGERLGVGAHLSGLRRTAVGHFDLSRALTLEGLESLAVEGRLSESLISPAETLVHLPALHLSRGEAERASKGQAIEAKGEIEENGLPVRLIDERGRLVAVGEREGRLVCPRVVLNEAASEG